MKYYLGLFFLILCKTSFSQLYTFENFNHKDGLTSGAILSIEEDKDGYLWLGSEHSGLIKFDGDKFDFLENLKFNSNNSVVSLASTPDNKIFIGASGKGFFEVNARQFDSIPFLEKTDHPRAIFIVKNQFVTIHDEGIKLYSNNKLVDEFKVISKNNPFHLFSKQIIEDKLFLFTSRGNFIIHNNKIETLHDWLSTSPKLTKNLVSVDKNGDSLLFINNLFTQEVTVLLDRFRPKFFISDSLRGVKLKKGEFISKSYNRLGVSVYATNKGRLFKKHRKNEEIVQITNNLNQKLPSPTDLMIDRNGDIWYTTRMAGVYRISLEPFTKFKLHELYNHPLIMFIHRTKDDDIVLSNADNITAVGNRYSNEDFKKYELRTKSVTKHKGKEIFSTDNGLYYCKNTRLIPSSISFFNGKKISLVHSGLGYLWVAEEGVGLFRVNTKTNEISKVDGAPAYIYTAQNRDEENTIYFGSNSGVFLIHKSNLEEPKPINSVIDGVDLGYYVGNSTVDKFKNLWFTFDEGIMGILTSGDIVQISGNKIFPSNLFYTLNSDNYGNLYIGTNRGITVLKLDSLGQLLNSTTYNHKNGFGGYETHMRSSYERPDGSIVVGTLEGLFLISPDILESSRAPYPPAITRVQSNTGSQEQVIDQDLFSSGENSFSFTFKSINTKSSFVQYSYRLRGINDKWSEWSEDNNAFFTGLPVGDYVFEVRSTINGTLISDITSYSFKIKIPFYKSKWFIFLGIGLIILLNFLILEKTKNFNRKNIIISRDVGTSKKMSASILLFGAFANTAANVFATRIDTTLENHDILTVITGVFIFVLFALLTFTSRFKHKAGLFLILGFFAVLAQNFYGVYYSNIHPFYLMTIIITLAVTPVVFRKLKAVIALAFIMLLISFSIVFIVEESVYNGFLFIVGVAIISILTVLLTYIRNGSLEKLIFTSGVVNKGNVLVIAFDQKGIISYSSENLANFLDVEIDELKGQHISEFNKFQPSLTEHKKFSNVDLTNEFSEGRIFVTPLFNKKGDLTYFQWSCKEFSEDVRVILGQDVTEKINLESYYELIVNNANDLIYQTDPLGKFTFVNDKCEEAFKYKRTEIIDKPVDFLLHPDYLESVKAFYKKQFRTKSRHSYLEFPIVNGENEVRWIGQNITTLFKPGTDSVITGFLGLARDITEKRKANAIIKEQNKDIKSSINYARRIQFNMLPRSVQFRNYFDEHFILFKPKDIVSGDFYWLEKVDNKVILICSDSTGHGVPGAFMTLLGINILNQIILEGGITDAAEILNELDSRLKEVLPRDGRNRVQDGMEAVVCVLDTKSDELEYATAGGRFGIIHDDDEDLTIYKLDHKHIGDADEVENFSYKKDVIHLRDTDTLYLFSDGYPDQFGGEKNKKLSIKRFIALLNGVSRQDLGEQNLILQDHLNEWIGELEQTDDITLIGIKGVKKSK